MIFKDLISKVNVLKKIKESAKTDLVFSLSGASIGEKILSIYACGEKCLIVADSAISMHEYKYGLECLGLNVAEVFVDLSAPLYSPFVDDKINLDTIKNLYAFLNGEIDVLIVPPEALLYRFVKKIETNSIIKLKVNNEYNFLELSEKLIKSGYKKCQKAEKSGDFAIRGDVLDIYLPNFDDLIRLEFFGDTLEKAYTYNQQEMQKIDSLEEINVYPISLYTLSKEEVEIAVQNLKNSLNLSAMEGDSLIKSHTTANEVIEGLNENVLRQDIPYLRPFMDGEYSIVDIVRDVCKIFVDEPKKIYDEICEVSTSILADIYDYISTGELLEDHAKFFLAPHKAIDFRPNYVFSSYEQNIFKISISDRLRTVGSRKYVFDYKSLVSDIIIYEKSKYKLVLFAGNESSQQAIIEFLLKHNIYPSDEINYNTNKFQIIVSPKKFIKSASFLDSGIILIGTDDLIKKTNQDATNISSKSKKRKVFYTPKVGDYVVHETHGIGKCIALEKLNLSGLEKEYFTIEYLGGDKLYLPSEQASSISAYMGGDNPKLNKIGGEQFAKVKQKVKESVSKLAINLLEIYSKREKTKGFVYSKDNYLYEEFENAFPYSETEDQLNAINDIKKDMESGRIMDRLVCGDVGYGKTEVALRAIYKAVLDGKQVAFLCPTTILSQQHYQTAKDRFKDFGVNVQVLNRFKTKNQQEQILKELKDGKIDVIIGTHRLLSKDVVFKDLGLLVLDEEQRFGVVDKEKIKDLKKDIDVLTLSATPIPRTLNMALTGIRDISIIETPPKERIAVKTYVQEESDALILSACRRELARGGQVLFVYNRVEHIYEQEERIKQLVPEARIGVAHGQMPEKLLEDTIMKLYNREFDILIATTLIESGIDLPLANTLIVIDSDRLGLSELYQLRGRIGRSDRTAYAYFTYNPAKILSNDAYRRLDAILEYTELGSGFKIAMRDLEIRGAGDILGKEQHGHLEKVGYDLYCKLLNDAVNELKGEKIKELKPIKLDIFASASILDKYVENEEERIKLYSSISSISSDEEYNDVYTKMQETYGDLPKETQRLLKIAFIKNLGIAVGLKRILINGSTCNLYLYKTPEILSARLNNCLMTRKNGVLKFDDVPIISFDMGFADIDYKIQFVLNFLKEGTKD